jgi:hypothetical protein
MYLCLCTVLFKNRLQQKPFEIIYPSLGELLQLLLLIHEVSVVQSAWSKDIHSYRFSLYTDESRHGIFNIIAIPRLWLWGSGRGSGGDRGCRSGEWPNRCWHYVMALYKYIKKIEYGMQLAYAVTNAPQHILWLHGFCKHWYNIRCTNNKYIIIIQQPWCIQWAAVPAAAQTREEGRLVPGGQFIG